MYPSKRNKIIKASLIIIGVVLILVSIFSDRLGLSSGAGIGYGQIFILVLGLTLLLIAFLSRKFLSVYKAIAIMLLNTLVILAALEFGALLIIKFTGVERFQQETVREQGQRASIEETGVMFPSQQFHPFVGWRSEPVSIPEMKIDSIGVRYTYGNPDSSEGEEVFMFGGSAMWGWMVPDSCTIPSYFQSILNGLNENEITVRNYAQNGFVSTQDMMELILKLQSGNIPETVVFYNGLNDILSAYENGRAGLLIGNRSISSRIEGRVEDPSARTPLLQVIDGTNTFLLVSHLFFRDTEWAPEETTVLVPANPCFDDPDFDISALSDEICNDYLGNYRIVEALSEEFGFDFYFFVQPVLPMSDKVLSNSELISIGMEDENLIELIDITYGKIAEQVSEYPQMRMNMSVFSGVEETVFTDICHLNANGNRIIAEYIASEIY